MNNGLIIFKMSGEDAEISDSSRYVKPQIEKHEGLTQITFSSHGEKSGKAPSSKDAKKQLLDNLFDLGAADGYSPEEIVREILKNPPEELRDKKK